LKAQTPDPYMLASQFLVDSYLVRKTKLYGKQYALRWWRGDYYVYRDGSYERLPDSEIQADVAGYLHAQGARVSRHLIGSIMLSMNHITRIDARQELDTWIDGSGGSEVMVAKNGNIDFGEIDKATGRPRLRPHSPLYFSKARLPYEYDPAADCPLWRDFLDDVMKGDTEYMLLLKQWAGYLLRRDLREHKFLLATGEGSNGKGVLFEVLEAMIGAPNCSHVPLARFGNPFALYATLGKRANITAETIHVIEEQAEALLKSFVAGDAMTFERKFKEPVEAVPTAKVMIATNAAPRFNDKTFGLWRRLLLVPFKKTIPANKQIKGLARELKGELPGILNWAIDGLASLNVNDGFSMPAAHEQRLEEYRRDSDPARAFLLEHYEESPGSESIVTTEIYAEYSRWCEANGCRPMNERTFGQHVRRIFPGAERARVGPRDARRRIYRGIASAVSHVSHAFLI